MRDILKIYNNRNLNGYNESTFYRNLIYELKFVGREAKEEIKWLPVDEVTEYHVEKLWGLIYWECLIRLDYKKFYKHNHITNREEAKWQRFKQVQNLKRQGLKQIQVSKILGVHPSTVCRHWRGWE
jgi:hypothetical protein